MSGQPRRCPKCSAAMPLARRRCPNCQSILPIGEETRALEVIYLQDRLSRRFDIISEISRRAECCIFQAQDLLLDRKVAIKTIVVPEDIDRDLLKKWEQNAKRAVRLDHPNIIRHFTAGKAGPLMYFISEFIPGSTLELHLRKTSRLPVWEALRIIRDIARAVQTAHNLGLCHHRLKLSNITAPSDGLSRVIDFGSSADLFDVLNERPWNNGPDSGDFLAPEQIESGLSDTYSDQYAIGMIAFVLITGSKPFSGEGEEPAFRKLSGQIEAMSKPDLPIPLDLENIIRRTLAVNPSDRFDDCRLFIEALESLDPELWAPHYSLTEYVTGTLGQYLAEAHRAEKNREYQKAVLLAEQAMVLAPYDTTVTDLLLRLRKSLDYANDVRSLINKGIAAFYELRLDTALTVLNRARQLDKDNPEIIRIIHEVLQEQERQRLVKVLIEAAQIDVEKNALSQAMAKIVKILDIDPGNKKVLDLRDRIESAMEDKATLSILYSQAEDAFCEERLTEAEDILNKILKIDPSHPEARQLLIKVGELRRAQKIVALRSTLEESMSSGNFEKAGEIVAFISKLDGNLGSELSQKILELKNLKEQPIGEPAVILPEEHPESAGADDRKEEPGIEEIGPPLVAEHVAVPETPATCVESTMEPEPEPPGSLPSEPDVGSDIDRNIEPPIQPKPLPVPETKKKPSKSARMKARSAKRRKSEKQINPQASAEKGLEYSLGPEKKTGFKYKWPAILTGSFIIIWLGIHIFFPADRHSDKQGMPPVVISPTTAAQSDYQIQETPFIRSTSSPEPTVTPIPTRTPLPLDPVALLMEEAANLEKSGNYHDALVRYNEALQINRSNMEAQIGVARCKRMGAGSVEPTRTPKMSQPSSTPKPRTVPPTAEIPVIILKTPAVPQQLPTVSPVPVISTSTPVPSPVPSMTPIPQSAAAKIAIRKIEFNPDPPITNKNLKISVTVAEPDQNKVEHCWFHYRHHGETGFQQQPGHRSRREFRFEIPASQIGTQTMEYFVSALDQNGIEITYGTPESPFTKSPSSDIFVPVNPL